MSRVKLCLLVVLLPILGSCASTRPLTGVYVAPRIDCAAYDVPPMSLPQPPGLTERDVRVWQLYAHGVVTYAEAVVGQRADTAQCLATLKAAGVIR